MTAVLPEDAGQHILASSFQLPSVSTLKKLVRMIPNPTAAGARPQACWFKALRLLNSAMIAPSMAAQLSPSKFG